MTRSRITHSAIMGAICVAYAMAGFPRHGIAGLVTGLAFLSAGAPRAGILAAAATSAGLIVALAAPSA